METEQMYPTGFTGKTLPNFLLLAYDNDRILLI